MGKLKIKKPKIQKNSIPAPLNITNFYNGTDIQTDRRKN